MSNNKGRLIIIAAPSGTGKGSILEHIKKLRPETQFSISVTTREPRSGENHGESYYFVTRECFLEMIDREELLEYTEYIGEYYGTPKKPIYEQIENGKDVILEIEVQGTKQVMNLDFELLTIFVIPPSMVELERRLRGRGTDPEENIIERLNRASQELEEMSFFSHIVVNDDLIRATEEILSIIDGAHQNI